VKSDRVRVRRQPGRARYDRAAIDAILDQALVCHLAFLDGDQPYAIPTLHARDGDVVYVHGSSAGRTQRLLGSGAPVCLTATLIDGLVLARSAFHHSVNYRSAVLLGEATAITDPEEKRHALARFVDKAAPGRWPHIRPPSPRELRATSVLSLPIAEASAKIRSGPPIDEPEDLALGVWAGVIPLELRAGEPEPAPDLRPPPSPAA
jgi:nitroimidazol reductase NimA-like FMN-containing flavoprotein (pyridoxamine 5'-phosphate oxidase superfamily)